MTEVTPSPENHRFSDFFEFYCLTNTPLTGGVFVVILAAWSYVCGSKRPSEIQLLTQVMGSVMLVPKNPNYGIRNAAEKIFTTS